MYNVKVKPHRFKHKQLNKKGGIKENKSKKPFHKKLPVSEEALARHSRGEGLNKQKIRTGVYRKRLEHKEKNIAYANEQAARTEILLTESSG